jgi:hypothetical protein
MRHAAGAETLACIATAWHIRAMPVPRRVILAAPLLMAAGRPASRGGSLRLRPGAPPVAYRLAPQIMASHLTFTGFRQPVVLPGEAVILGTYPIAGREILAVGFDASALAGVTQKLAALVGWDGKELRILDIETLTFSSGDNGSQSRLSAHITAGPSHDQLRYTAEASRSERGKPPRHESWTDTLTWREGAPLTIATPNKAGGPWQNRMEASRARLATLLATPRTALTLDMLDPTGLLDPLGSSPQ